MDKWIKENKIIINIIIVFAATFVIVYFSKQSSISNVITRPSAQITPKTDKLLDTSKTESDLSLQIKCSDMGTKFYASMSFGDKSTYTTHLNSKLNKCFILIYNYTPSIFNNDDSNTVNIDLYDVIERKHYANYIGNDVCNTANGDCLNNAGVVWFDGNDKKFPDDAVGSCRPGDIGCGENVQKQFLDHIQSFMID